MNKQINKSLRHQRGKEDYTHLVSNPPTTPLVSQLRRCQQTASILDHFYCSPQISSILLLKVNNKCWSTATILLRIWYTARGKMTSPHWLRSYSEAHFFHWYFIQSPERCPGPSFCVSMSVTSRLFPLQDSACTSPGEAPAVLCMVSNTVVTATLNTILITVICILNVPKGPITKGLVSSLWWYREMVELLGSRA
jgi:hypothetical protein